MRFIVTGGVGFFGSIACNYLLSAGHEVVSIDRLSGEDLKPKYPNIQLDITDAHALRKTLESLAPIDCIFHVAALLAHDKKELDHLWKSNVEGTRNVMEAAKILRIPKVVFTSTNCVFSSGFPNPVDESTPTHPIETYGESKLEAEKIVLGYDTVQSIIIRCPTILSPGRLGLLTILFDFVREGRRLYLVGSGNNRYSFISAEDLASACLMAAQSKVSGIYHIGSDNVPTMRNLYGELQKFAGQKVKLVSIPEAPTVLALNLLNSLKLSPLGPYHYRMLAANFVFSNEKIKQDLNWKPTRNNTEILCDAYKYYVDHLDEINSASGRSAHRSRADAGILDLLRILS